MSVGAGKWDGGVGMKKYFLVDSDRMLLLFASFHLVIPIKGPYLSSKSILFNNPSISSSFFIFIRIESILRIWSSIKNISVKVFIK